MTEACSGGHLSIAEILLHHDSNGLLEITDESGWTPLVFASHAGRVNVVRFLLEHGANVHAVATDGRTALMVACQSGIGLEIVRQLLAAGSDLEARDRTQATALHKAAIHGVVDVLRELILHHKANLFAVDEDGNTPFDVACSRKISEVVNPMLEIYGSKLTKEYGPLASHALLITAKYSFSETRPFHPPLYPLQIRLPLGMPPLEHLRTLLQTLDTESIRNRDDSGKLPIHIACQTNAPVEILAMLVEQDPTSLQIADSSGNLPLHECCSGSVDYSSMRYLVNQGGVGTLAARNHQGALPLHVLCGSTNPSWRTVQYLIQSFPGSVSTRTHSGMAAATDSSGSTSSTLSVVCELVRAGPDVLIVPLRVRI